MKNEIFYYSSFQQNPRKINGVKSTFYEHQNEFPKVFAIIDARKYNFIS